MANLPLKSLGWRFWVQDCLDLIQHMQKPGFTRSPNWKVTLGSHLLGNQPGLGPLRSGTIREVRSQGCSSCQCCQHCFKQAGFLQ